MPKGFTFKRLSKANLAWHPELGEGYTGWLWLDGRGLLERSQRGFPLVPRAGIAGTLTFRDKPMKVKGLGYIERQLLNLTFEGTVSHWLRGHFYAGDDTAVRTASASYERTQYRPFRPFVLFKGSDAILSTHNLARHAERFVPDETAGRPYPVVETLQANVGNTEVTTVLLAGKAIERQLLIDTPGTVFEADNPGGHLRRFCDVNLQIRC